MNNVQVFNVAPSMPQELEFLERLAQDMWWCWHTDAIELFRRIDLVLWKDTGHNPLKFFGSLSQERLEALVDDEGFMSHYDQVQQRFESESGSSTDTKGGQALSDCIAYFSLEYGIHESVRLYSGGLGCLAGDHLKAASDMGLPMVGVGLLYKCGYFQQFMSEDGWQQEACPENKIHHLPLSKAVDSDGVQIMIKLPLPDGILKAAVWRLQVGRVPLYLLDTNIPDNPPGLREITWQLYEADRKIRLRQELLLGVGGFRALIALGYEPAVCHINEGHAAFMSLQRLSHLVQQKGVGLDAAGEVVRRTNVFTTHTPVPAGNETFSLDLVQPHLDALKKDLGIEPDQILAWGGASGKAADQRLSMTVLGLRMAELNNGVSKLHGEVARKMWAYLWPGRPVDELPIQHVTNGVHVPSWISSDNAALYDRYLGPEWRENPSSEDMLERIPAIPDEELWRVHQTNRSRLVRAARDRGEQQFVARNSSRAQVAEIRTVLHHDVLTIGFARRFATYKRAVLLLKDPARLEALLTNKDRPVQMIFAGKAHPADNAAKELIQEIIRFARRPNIRQRMIFLEDYDIQIGRYLVQGVDVWLNTPRRPQEASGTSGMKAAINGALHVSVLDGWWDEGYEPGCGFAIGEGEEYENVDYQDTVESQALYNLLENEVIPRFYDRADGGSPPKWTKMMKASIGKAFSYFTSHRMLSEYRTRFYEPATEKYKDLTADDAAKARALVGQKERLRSLWGKISIGQPTTDRDISVLHVGDKFSVTVIVNLGELDPKEVDVEVYHGPVSSTNQIERSHAELMTGMESKGEGVYVYTHELTCRETGRYGFTARVTPEGTTWKHTMPGYITWADGH